MCYWRWFGSVMCYDFYKVEPSVKFGEWGIYFVIISINEKDYDVFLTLYFSDESAKVM